MSLSPYNHIEVEMYNCRPLNQISIDIKVEPTKLVHYQQSGYISCHPHTKSSFKVVIKDLLPLFVPEFQFTHVFNYESLLCEILDSIRYKCEIHSPQVMCPLLTS